jgi:hypothetical protein
MCKRGTRACFHHWIFNPRIFHMLFYCQKLAFVCEFQHTPLCKMTFFLRLQKSCGYEILLTCTQLTLKQEFEVP